MAEPLRVRINETPRRLSLRERRAQGERPILDMLTPEAGITGLGAAWLMGPAGLLLGVGQGILGKRMKKAELERAAQEQEVMSQFSEGFARQFDEAGRSANTPMDRDQLEAVGARFAQARQLMRHPDEEVRSRALEMLLDADAGLGGTLEDIEGRSESIEDKAITALQQDRRDIQNQLKVTQERRTTFQDQFVQAMTILGDPDVPEELAKATFTDFIDLRAESDPGILAALLGGVGALAGSAIPGRGGQRAGQGIGRSVGESLAEVDVPRTEMIRIATALHKAQLDGADTLIQQQAQQLGQVDDVLSGFGRSLRPSPQGEQYAPSQSYEAARAMGDNPLVFGQEREAIRDFAREEFGSGAAVAERAAREGDSAAVEYLRRRAERRRAVRERGLANGLPEEQLPVEETP